MSFPDWVRASGINILKSKPDNIIETLQMKTGTGEFVFWSAQDPPYTSFNKDPHSWDDMDMHKIVDTLVITSKIYSQQTRHLRDRVEPETGERGAGLYIPEDILGYTISSIEIALRGTGPRDTIVADSLTESQIRTIRGINTCLVKLAAAQYPGKADGGRESVKQAIIKRLLPEWSRTHTNLSCPFLLRDPFTILIETAAMAPEMLPHVLTLTYYAALARAAIGVTHILHKNRSPMSVPARERYHEDLFGDIRMFVMSVVRHSPIFEGIAHAVFKAYGDTPVDRLMYAFTLPFLRRAMILCRAVVPDAFPTPVYDHDEPCEYERLLAALHIPPLSDLPNQDAIQNALSGWCAHYGHLHAANSKLNDTGVYLDHPTVYSLARLPPILDYLFDAKGLVCQRCNTAPLDAAICLFCGTVCCMQSHCCTDLDWSRGECNMHTRECGGAIGVYFLVKRCALLYLSGGNGTFGPSPYLDVHGEVDQAMRRGRRQYLHQARWEDIRKLWLNHGIPTHVARKLESTVDSGGWETL